jgi:hypothetical protein
MQRGRNPHCCANFRCGLGLLDPRLAAACAGNPGEAIHEAPASYERSKKRISTCVPDPP